METTRRRAASLQLRVLSERLLDDLLANPGSVVLTLIFGIGFLFTYYGQLGGTLSLAHGVGSDYLAFIVPTAVLVASFGGAAGGYLLARDIEDCYVDRLLMLPVSHVVVVVAPMLVGAAYATTQAATILLLGAILGAMPVTGFAGALGILGLAAIWGMGVTGYMTAVALLARDVEVVRLVDLCFFALLFFLSPILLPRGELASWLQPISDANPASYILEGLRALMLHGWTLANLWPALLAGASFAAATLLAALAATRRSLSG